MSQRPRRPRSRSSIPKPDHPSPPSAGPSSPNPGSSSASPRKEKAKGRRGRGEEDNRESYHTTTPQRTRSSRPSSTPRSNDPSAHSPASPSSPPNPGSSSTSPSKGKGKGKGKGKEDKAEDQSEGQGADTGKPTRTVIDEICAALAEPDDPDSSDTSSVLDREEVSPMLPQAVAIPMRRLRPRIVITSERGDEEIDSDDLTEGDLGSPGAPPMPTNLPAAPSGQSQSGERQEEEVVGVGLSGRRWCLRWCRRRHQRVSAVSAWLAGLVFVGLMFYQSISTHPMWLRWTILTMGAFLFIGLVCLAVGYND